MNKPIGNLYQRIGVNSKNPISLAGFIIVNNKYKVSIRHEQLTEGHVVIKKYEENRASMQIGTENKHRFSEETYRISTYYTYQSYSKVILRTLQSLH